jgi:hypothetical protein
MHMIRNKMSSLFAAMVCTFCLATVAFGAEVKKPDGALAGVASPTHRAPGFHETALSDNLIGDLMVLGGPPANAVSGNAAVSRRIRLTGLGPDIFKVLSVLERRTGNQGLIEKARYKLVGMSERRIRLAARLSERIIDEGPGAKTDIAFLLLTTLIVFS